MQIANVRKYFIDSLKEEKYVIDKTGVKTIELVGASFVADEPAIFGEPNQDYINREIEWYCSHSLNVNDIPGEVPKIWEMVSDRDGFIHSNYGYLVHDEGNHFQFKNVLDELIINPTSRRAVMIYTRPTMHYEYNKNGMSDFICTNAVQYMIRDDKIHAVVQMRSNDVIFGYRNDYAWQKFTLDGLCETYYDATGDCLQPGDITWQVGSLHVYERHFHLVK